MTYLLYLGGDYMFKFEKINLIDMIIVIGLTIALFVAIVFCGEISSGQSLANTIAAGLLGYIGGTAAHREEIR